MDIPGNADQERPDFLWRIGSKLKAADIEGQVRKVLKDEFNAALAEEAVIMSRKARKRLFAQIVRNTMEDILADLEPGTG